MAPCKVEDVLAHAIRDKAWWDQVTAAAKAGDDYRLNELLAQKNCPLSSSELQRLKDAIKNPVSVDLDALVSHLAAQPGGWPGAVLPGTGGG